MILLLIKRRKFDSGQKPLLIKVIQLLNLFNASFALNPTIIILVVFTTSNNKDEFY